jgi:predicted metal-dependent hydrolase
MRLDWSSGALAEGLRCYRADEFFLAHEHWEGVWLEAQEPEKTFLQALIQTAAAFHHLQRGNRTGAASLLRAALRRMEPHEISFGGVRVGKLRGELEAWVKAFEAEDGEIRLAVPDIPLEDSSGERE